MIVPVMAISNLVLTRQLYSSEETNGAHAHYREPVPLTQLVPAVYCPPWVVLPTQGVG